MISFANWLLSTSYVDDALLFEYNLKTKTINKVLKDQQSVISSFDKVHQSKTCSETQNEIKLSWKITASRRDHQTIRMSDHMGRVGTLPNQNTTCDFNST